MSDWPEWWTPKALPDYRAQNAWLRRLTCTMEPVEGFTNWHGYGNEFDRLFERLAWLYELDARIRGCFLLGCSVAYFDESQGAALMLPVNPTDGESSLRMVLMESPGEPSERTTFSREIIFGSRKSGAKAAKPITVNLGASDVKLERYLTAVLPSFGITVTRAPLRAAIAELRRQYGIPAPTPSPMKGDRRGNIPWEWLGPVLAATKAGKVVDLNRKSRISDARRIHRDSLPIIEQWEYQSAAHIPHFKRRRANS
jgi:hypothetical protein